MTAPGDRTSGGIDGVTAVVPVKPLALAKSRLALPVELRAALALAFVLDTVAALVDSPRVRAIVVVTADRGVERALRDLPVHLLGDPGGGLLGAVTAGCRFADGRRPGAGLAVVPADLPCLSAADVTQVLRLAQGTDGAYVEDSASTGTTFLVSPSGRRWAPQYGPGSADRHRAQGLACLEDAPPGARLDVDTLADLQAAERLGLGAWTAAQVTALGDLGPAASLTA